MSQFEILILGIVLAIDSMIVSFSYGLKINERKIYNSIKLALVFGFFQSVMPVIGWVVSSSFYNLLSAYSKWIVFGIFIVLGIKFLFENEEKKETAQNCISRMCLISFGIATSIDALGAGITIKFTGEGIFIPAIEIGIVTVLLSFTGFWIANKLTKLPSRIMEITGAVLLICLGIKSLF